MRKRATKYNKFRIIVAILILLLLLIITSYIVYENIENQKEAKITEQEKMIEDEAAAKKQQMKDQIILVNKTHPMDPENDPGGLTEETKLAFAKMQEDAAKEGVDLQITSDYRSYEEQAATFDYWVANMGEEAAHRESAEAGYSEHQTGLVIDVKSVSNPICNLETCFYDTPEGTWISNNSYKYGFIVRYPQGSEEITGYSYEPWHIRYVGVEAATDIYDQQITLEEYLDRD